MASNQSRSVYTQSMNSGIRTVREATEVTVRLEDDVNKTRKKIIFQEEMPFDREGLINAGNSSLVLATTCVDAIGKN